MRKSLLAVLLLTTFALTACGSGLQGSFSNRNQAAEPWTLQVSDFHYNESQQFVANFTASYSGPKAETAQEPFTYTINFDGKQLITETVTFETNQEATLISEKVEITAGKTHEAIACIHKGAPSSWPASGPTNSACKNLRF